jgi:hypothetical protein
LLENPDIKKYISIREKREIERLQKETSITKEWVLSVLKASAERSIARAKERELTLATAQINAMLGYLAPVKVETTDKQQLDLTKVTNDDLAELSNKLKRIASKGKSVAVVDKEHINPEPVPVETKPETPILQLVQAESDGNRKTANS